MDRKFAKSLALFIAAMLQLMAADGAKAGNWSSGGGEILEHAQNPWFLEKKDTKDPIRYCIAKGDDFPVDLDKLESLVIQTFNWWTDQFSNAHYPDNLVSISGKVVNLQVRVNTTYVKVACSDDPELSFQFGTLTDKQEKEFERLQVDLTRYVALTIRTDYSEALRGKGFIYISPDRGENRFKGQNVKPDVWTDPFSTFPLVSPLQLVLAHELGHVFGLAHDNSNDALMSARLAEMAVSRRLKPYAFIGINNPVFFPAAKEILRVCGEQDRYKAFRDFFEIPTEMRCFSVSLNLQVLSISMWEDEASARYQTQVGFARFDDGGQRRHRQLVTLWLPHKQTFIPGLPDYVSSLFGPASSEVQHAAVFNEGSPREKAIFVQASSQYVQIGGISDNRIIPDLLPESAHGGALSGWSSN